MLTLSFKQQLLQDVYKELGPMTLCGVLHVTYQTSEQTIDLTWSSKENGSQSRKVGLDRKALKNFGQLGDEKFFPMLVSNG